MKLQNGIKTLNLGNGEKVHFWYANNKGNGDSNVTIARSTADRAACSAKQADVIAITKTSAWAGNVNYSKSVRRCLGLD